MEPQITQQGNEAGNKASNANMGCRQSSSRWTPTTDQIRILKELYYNKGVRSPSTDQIHRICLQLKRYGKIEGKNVFYWFQNHKARERQKKRFTPDSHAPMQRGGVLVGNNGNNNSSSSSNWKPEEYLNMNNKYPNVCQCDLTDKESFFNLFRLLGVSSGPPSVSSAGLIGFNGQMGNYGGYGSMNMEKSFRDCSISAGSATASVGVRGSITSHNFESWVGGNCDPYSSSSSSYTTIPTSTNFFDMKKQHDFMEIEEEEEEEEYHHNHHHQEIETLPLFPMHGEEFYGGVKASSDGYGYCSARWGGGYNGGARASLELSLNSYGYTNPSYY